MNKALKILLFAALCLYVFSPVDCAPGPVDDLILILVYAVFNRRKAGPVGMIGEAGTSQDA